MFVSPIEKGNSLGKKAWDNLIIFEDGQFYAFFGTGYKSEQNQNGYPKALDVATSKDGVHWDFIARNVCYIDSAHAGYCVKRIGEYFYYYPTCSIPFKSDTVHFKVYRTKDFNEWEYLGSQFDVYPDKRYYAERWEEMMILEDFDESGEPVYYGYLSSENNPEYAPSAAMVKSYDGISWDVLPPVIIEWGETPAQHGELNFVFKLGERYYFSNTFRAFMDTYGFGAYSFVGESCFGPFKPDLEMFRISGNSRRDVSWFTHFTNMPDGSILGALWLSHDNKREIPSASFAIGSLKKFITENGHLRLVYWQGTEAAKGDKIKNWGMELVYPSEVLKSTNDSLINDGSSITLSASRNGAISMLNCELDREQGFIIEGELTAFEGRHESKNTHLHAAGAGFLFEGESGSGIAIVPDTLGVTRSGKMYFGETKITDFDIYEHIELVQMRSGKLNGTLFFDYDDTVGPFGNAAYCGIRHGKKHSFKLLARGDYFELFIDNYYVQTYLLPEKMSGRVGFCTFDGKCMFENISIYKMDFKE